MTGKHAPVTGSRAGIGRGTGAGALCAEMLNRTLNRYGEKEGRPEDGDQCRFVNCDHAEGREIVIKEIVITKGDTS